MKKYLVLIILVLVAGVHPGLLRALVLNLDYSTYLGGSGEDWGHAISVGTDGMAYVAGYTWSSDFPTENPYQATPGGGTTDAFVSALSSTGSALYYSTYLGGSSWDEGWGISVGTAGAAYVTGYTESIDFPTENPYQAAFGGYWDVFVTALSSTGSALYYSTYLGGSEDDEGYEISVGTDGMAWVTGFTTSPDNFPMENPYQAAFGGVEDVFVSALSSTGSALYYSTYLGGSDEDRGYGISLGTDGAAYVAGYTWSSDFPTENPYQVSNAGSWDVFVSALTSTGSALFYSTYLGGSVTDRGWGISLGTDGRAYVTGDTNSTNFPTENPYQAGKATGQKVFVSALTSTGSALAYSTYLGGSGYDQGWGISVGTDGAAWVTGETNSSDFPTENPYQAGYAGSGDGFVSVLDSSGSALSYSTYLGGSSGEEGYGISLGPAGAAYITGWTGSADFPTKNPYQAGIAGIVRDGFVSRLAIRATPTPSVTPTPTVTPTPSVTPTPTVTPTPSVTPTPPPTTTPTPTPTATPTPSSLPTSSPTPSPPPTATSTPTPRPGAVSPPWIYDYNGDGTSDIAIFRSSIGLWAIRDLTRVYFGASTDETVPGDYDGDRTTDIGIFRPSSGLWALRGVSRIYFGGSADETVPGDYDGSGTWSVGIFRPTSGLWAVRGAPRIYFGSSADVPSPGYYAGGLSRDIAIFRPAAGLWAIRGITRIYFGGSSDEPVPGDYDGSGTWGVGIFRPTSGLWAVRGVTRIYFGSGSDQPVPADYDGNSVDDVGIFRAGSGLWAARGVSRIYFGTSGDAPVTR